MEFFTFALLGVLLLLSVLVFWNRNARTKGPVGTKEVPSPPALPYIGHLFEFLKAGDNSLPVFEKYLYSLGKIFRITIMGLDFVVINEPELIKHIMTTKFGEVYHKGEDFQEQYHSFLGKGIFVSNGDEWKMHRQIASSLFQTSELKRHTTVFKKQAIVLVKKLNTLKEKAIDMQDYFMRYTLDTFSEIGFGVQLKSIDQEVNRFQTAFDYVQFETDHRGTKGKLWKYIPDKRYDSELSYMNDFIENIINNRRNESEEETSQKKDLLSQVMTRRDEAGKRLYDEEGLRDFVMNFLIAGRDTTAVTLTWCFYLLSQHPEVEQKLMEEMESVLGPSPANPDDDSSEPEIDWENLKRLKYMKAVLYETLRLYPPVPIDGYQASKDDVMPGDYFIPKGTVVLYSAYTLHRHPDYFPEPEKFKPERFENVQPPAYTWVPFHGGPRLCLGQEMAILEAKIFMCVFMWRYRQLLRLSPEAHIQLKRGIILTAKYGVKMNLTHQ